MATLRRGQLHWGLLLHREDPYDFRMPAEYGRVERTQTGAGPGIDRHPRRNQPRHLGYVTTCRCADEIVIGHKRTLLPESIAATDGPP